MQNTKDGIDDVKKEYTGKMIYLEEIRDVAKDLKNGLVDRDTNFDMNESYRAALEDLIRALENLA